jgi:hypothetical protein
MPNHLQYRASKYVNVRNDITQWSKKSWLMK